MKIQYRQIESFVKNPDKKARVILVYGPDDGLMRERAKSIGLSVVEDINDPFNVAVLSGNILAEDPARLSDEASAVSMMGGDRLVRVEEAGDKITPLVKEYLENPFETALIVLEAGELGPRSSLRKLCETAKNAAALPCYVEDERDLSRLIRETVTEAGLTIEPDAVAFLAVNIAGNRQKARRELEKLIIYKGEETSPITLGDAQAACGEAGARGFDDLVYSVGGNQSEKALLTYNQLLEEGVPFIAILRALQNHFRRLHATRARMDSGEAAEQAMKSLRPPVFFKQAPAFQTQVQKWPLKTLDSILSRLVDLEAQCKQTGSPTETLCAQAVLGLSAMRG